MQDAMDRAWLAEAVDMARKLWRAYLIEPSEESVQFIVDAMDSQLLSLIGTGKHEFYADLASFFAGLERDQQEAQDVVFEILDEYYEPRPIGVDSCLVFGTLWVRERPDQPKPLLVEMDTRFTLVFRRDGDRLLLTHLHHSTPNIDQRREEYYPKTATEQANAALEHSKAMERRAELDSMTELLNHAAFEKHVATALIEGGEAVFALADGLGALATFISGAGPTIMAIVDASCRDFGDCIARRLPGMGLGGWRVHTLSIDNTGTKITHG